MMRALIILFLLLCCPTAPFAATIFSGGSRVDLSNAVASAAIAGDTISVTNGTYDWPDSLTINKSIRFIVNGTNVIIRDNQAADIANIKVIPPSDGNVRFEGFEFQDAIGGARKFTAFIEAAGTNSDSFASGRLIIKNCTFRDVNKQCVFWYGCWGLVRGTRHYLRDGTFIAHYIYQDVLSYTGSDRVWSMATTNLAGKNVGVIIEDNEFTRPGPSNYALTDAYFGAVYTVRSNFINRCWVEAHGTDSGGRRRGTRWVEIYGNQFTSNTYIANFRSGSGIIASNQCTNYTAYTVLPLISADAYRRHFPFALWESCTGTNGWDTNGLSNPLETGTSTSGGELFLTDTTKSWPANQWQGKQFHWTGVTNKYKATVILSNTATTLYLMNSGATAVLSGWSELTLSNACTYEINEVIEALDQPGRCCGPLLSGDNPTPVNGQIDDAMYEWQNSGEAGVDINISTSTPFVRANEHYFNNTSRPGWVPFTYPHPDGGSPDEVPPISANGLVNIALE